MNWETARKRVLERDEGMCVKCGDMAEHVHHRVTRGMGGSKDEHLWFSPEMLVSLCFRCHREIHDHPAESYESGFLVRHWGDPGEVTLTIGSTTWMLMPDGTKTPGECGPTLF